MSDLHHLLVEFANAVQTASRRQRTEYLRVFHDRIAALSAPAPQGIGREALRDSVKFALRDYRHGGASINETADAILALLPTEPPAQGEG